MFYLFSLYITVSFLYNVLRLSVTLRLLWLVLVRLPKSSSPLLVLRQQVHFVAPNSVKIRIMLTWLPIRQNRSSSLYRFYILKKHLTLGQHLLHFTSRSFSIVGAGGQSDNLVNAFDEVLKNTR
jgi:hypothetical protein